MTTTAIEYALMAGASYLSTRPDINKFPIPQGWLPFFHVPDLATPNFPTTSGFEAVSFSKGTEIVISYAGTYDKDMSGDMVANAGLATGVGSVQLLQATEYYLQVKVANPGATITLTGHSLGGGLAALVGVFFGVQTTTFDQAPFVKTAWSSADTVKTYLVGRLDASGNRIYSDATLAPLNSYIGQQQAAPNPSTFIPNAGLVSNINAQGEFLSSFPWNIYGRIGTTTEAIGNSATGVSGQDLHTQALLAAFLQSRQTTINGKALNDVTFKLPDLLKMVFDPQLFAYRTDDASNRNLIDYLVRHEAGVQGSFGADTMVTRFTTDLWKLAQDGGLTMSDKNTLNPQLNEVSKTLMAFAMQKYYEETSTSAGYTKELFTDVTGGIQFDLADVSTKFATAFQNHDRLNLTDAKGFALYFKNYLQSLNSFSDDDRELIQSMLPNMRDWYVQAGAGAMIATDILNRGAFMLGGSGADTLTGGLSVDLLVGNAGSDTLTGGQGNDLLLGGKGNDTYTYQSANAVTGYTGDGLDTILDSDGQGSVQIDGQTLSGGAQYGDARVYRDANGHVYTNVGTGLVIDGNILVQNWQAGNLGLNMRPAPADANPTTTLDITGDLAPVDQDLTIADLQIGFDALGNVFVNPNVIETDSADYLYDSAGNDHIVSGGGDDVIDAGAGRDDVYAGAGNDVISGGAGGDVIDGGTGNDLIYADSQTDIATAIAQGNTVAGINAQGDWLAGAEGDDTLVGSAANDVLMGGAGADLLIGGAGNDDIMGDPDWLASDFNWTVTDQAGGMRYFYPVLSYAPATDGAVDVIFGEGSADKLQGGAVNDAILGGAGSDHILGGDGADFINSSAILNVSQRFKLGDSWGPPAGQVVLTQGAPWGIYQDALNSDPVTMWSGSDNRAGTDGDVDGGAGNDRIDGVAIHSVATYAHQSAATGQFDWEDWRLFFDPAWRRYRGQWSGQGEPWVSVNDTSFRSAA